MNKINATEAVPDALVVCSPSTATSPEPVGLAIRPTPPFSHASDEDLEIIDAGMTAVENAIADLLSMIETLKAEAEAAEQLSGDHAIPLHTDRSVTP